MQDYEVIFVDFIKRFTMVPDERVIKVGVHGIGGPDEQVGGGGSA